MTNEELHDAVIEDLKRELKRFSPEELAWDFHCGKGEGENFRLIAAEVRSRKLNPCSIGQRRRGGAPTLSMRGVAEPCGGCDRVGGAG